MSKVRDIKQKMDLISEGYPRWQTQWIICNNQIVKGTGIRIVMGCDPSPASTSSVCPKVSLRVYMVGASIWGLHKHAKLSAYIAQLVILRWFLFRMTSYAWLSCLLCVSSLALLTDLEEVADFHSLWKYFHIQTLSFTWLLQLWLCKPGPAWARSVPRK